MLRDADSGAVDQDDPETCLWRAASIRPPPEAHLACAELETVTFVDTRLPIENEHLCGS
jgi:hypothetical protein